jgi:ribonuclease HII
MPPRIAPDSLPLDLPSGPTFDRERRLKRRGIWPVAGVDEVGRGPLAGPVVAAAVILDPKRVPKGLDDSKALDAATREALFGEIAATAIVGVASISARMIDMINIREASLLAMRRAILALHVSPVYAFVDGRDRPDLPCAMDAIIRGDANVSSIAAASIVAKVTRDRLMTRLCAHHPAYGFSRHMGYATPEHRAAIRAHGPCPYHRLSFAPFRLESEAAAELKTADLLEV